MYNGYGLHKYMDFSYDLETHKWTRTDTNTKKYRLLVLNHVTPIPNFYETWKDFVRTDEYVKHNYGGDNLIEVINDVYFSDEYIPTVNPFNGYIGQHDVFRCNILTGQWMRGYPLMERFSIMNIIYDHILLQQHRDIRDMKMVFDHIRGSSRFMDEFMAVVREKCPITVNPATVKPVTDHPVTVPATPLQTL